MAGDLHLRMKGRDHFRAQFSGMRRSSCKFCDVSQILHLLTAPRPRVSDSFELSIINITLRSAGDEDYPNWSSTVSVENILSKSVSMPTYLSGKGS